MGFMDVFRTKKSSPATKPLPTWKAEEDPDMEYYDGQELLDEEERLKPYADMPNTNILEPSSTALAEQEAPKSLNTGWDEKDFNKVIKDHISFTTEGYTVQYQRYTMNLLVMYNDTELCNHALSDTPNTVKYKDLDDALKEYMQEHQREVYRYHRKLALYRKAKELPAPLEEAYERKEVGTDSGDTVLMDIYLYAQYVDRPEPPKNPKGVEQISYDQSGYDLVYLAFPVTVNNEPVQFDRPYFNGKLYGVEHPEETDKKMVSKYFSYKVDAGQHPSNVINELGFYAAEFFLDLFNPNRNAEDLLRTSKNVTIDEKHQKRVDDALERSRRGNVNDEDHLQEALSRKARSVR